MKKILKSDNRLEEINNANNDFCYILSKKANDIFNHWKILAAIKDSPLTNHTFKSNVTKRGLIRAKGFLKKYEKHIIKRAITRYYLLLKSPYTNIQNGNFSIVNGFDEFFKFNDFTKQRAKKYNKKIQIRSWFKECLSNEVFKKYLSKNVKEKLSLSDENKKWLKFVKFLYSTKIMKRKIKTSKEIEESKFEDEMKFVAGSKKLMIYYKKNKKRFNHYYIENEFHFVNLLFDSLEEKYKDFVKITPGFLCSNKTFSEVFPNFLEKNNYIKE